MEGGGREGMLRGRGMCEATDRKERGGERECEMERGGEGE